ncbi:MAG TPA: GNAT family N-acetyltransferase [Polyangiaceae bacterium]|nr:GNAT family N-acetyltransferase [Polyangiaceae bacterium]
MSPEPDRSLELRPLVDDDVDLVRLWLTQEHIRPWYAKPEEWLREMRERQGEFAFIHHLIACEGEEPIGFCQYYRCEASGEPEFRAYWSKNGYSIDYLLAASYLGRGLGKALVNALADVVFEKTSAWVIVVQPERDNVASRATLIASGFEHDADHDLFVRWRTDEVTRPIPRL